MHAKPGTGRLTPAILTLGTMLFFLYSQSLFAATDTSVISYHWQPSKGYTLGSYYPAGDFWTANQAAATLPALISAGSNSALNMFIVYSSNSTAFTKEVTNALWLDTAEDGKRYSITRYLPLITTIDSTQGCSKTSQTVYYFSKNANPYAEAIIVRNGKKFHIVCDESWVENDSLRIKTYNPAMTTIFKVNINTYIRSGVWTPYFMRLDYVNNDTVLVQFGIGKTVYASSKCAGSASSDASRITFYSVDAWHQNNSQVSDVHLFCSSDPALTVPALWTKYFSVVSMNGPVGRVPLLIHNVIYDPPGNQSYETCQFDTSTQTNFNYSFALSGSGSVETGIKSSLSTGEGVSVSTSYTATVKGEAHFAATSDTSSSVALSTSTATSSMNDGENAIFMGPTFGDVVVYESYAYRAIMIKRPRMSKFLTASNPGDFVWAIGGCIPLQDSCTIINYDPIQTLVKKLQGDSADLSFLQQEYPYDLKTGKLIPSTMVAGVNHKGKTVPARVAPLAGEGSYSIGGSITHDYSITRETITSKDTNSTWGASVTGDFALWSPTVGAEVTITGGADFAIGMGKTSAKGSTIAYHFEDNISWNKFYITPYVDNRFKTVLFKLDSANSWSSFPYQASTQRAVSWEIASMPACTGYVGQATTITVYVKNTSPNAELTALPNAFTFSVSAVNFSGTYTVYPENVKIASGSTVPFTVTLTGASAGTFVQEMEITCYHPTNGSTMSESRTFPLTMKTADVGLVVRLPQDTFKINTGSTIFHTFNAKLVNTGVLGANVIFGADSASAGTTVSYGSFSNPVAPGDSASLSISLTGTGSQTYYTASFWTQIQGEPATLSHHTIVIKVMPPTNVVANLNKVIIKELGIINTGSGRLELFVPQNETSTMKLFHVNGQVLLTKNLAAGMTVLDLKALRLARGLYIIQLQGKKTLQQKILVSGKQ